MTQQVCESASERWNFHAVRAVEKNHFVRAPTADHDFICGTMLGVMGLHEEAAEYFRRAVSARSTAGGEFNLGLSLLYCGEPSEALACFGRASAHDEELTEARRLSEKLAAWLSVGEGSRDGAAPGDSRLALLEGHGRICERLRGAEVELEPLLPAHAAAVREYATRAVTTAARLPPLDGEGAALEWVRTLAAEPRNYAFAVTRRGEFVGVAALTKFGGKAGNFFYWVGAPFAGRGYATAALCLLLRFGFDTLRLDEVYTCVLPDNLPSARILRGLGFEGVEGPNPGLDYYRKGVARLDPREAAARLRRAAPTVVVRTL